MSQEASGLKEDHKKVLKRAIFMASGVLTSRVLGLFRDMAMAALFERPITDAWAAAFRLPNLFRRLLGEGSFSVSFIPVFIEAQGGDASQVRAHNLVNSVYSFLLVVTSVLTLLGLLFTEPLFQLLMSSSYALDAPRWELTLYMGRIMMGFVFFISSYAFFMALLNALGSFALPSAAAALLNVSMLVFTFMPSSWFGVHGAQLAWGVFVGGMLQSSILAYALFKRNFLPKWSWNVTPDLKRVLSPLLSGIVGAGLYPLMALLNLYFSSGLDVGAISYLYWADRLLELPLSLVSVSIGSALLPTLSELAFGKRLGDFRTVLSDQFLINFFFSWPAALGIFFLAEPIVEVLFLRGHFSAEDLRQTVAVLRVYGLGVFIISSVRVLVPAFYALQKTWIPTWTSLVALAVHFSVAPWAIQKWGLVGLVSSSILIMLGQLICFVVALPSLSAGLAIKRLLSQGGRMILSGGVLVAAISLYSSWVRFFDAGSELRAVLLFVLIAISAGLYFLTAYLLKVEASEQLLRALVKKFKAQGIQ